MSDRGNLRCGTDISYKASGMKGYQAQHSGTVGLRMLASVFPGGDLYMRAGLVASTDGFGYVTDSTLHVFLTVCMIK